MDPPRTFGEAFRGKRSQLVAKMTISSLFLIDLEDKEIIFKSQRQEIESLSTEHDKVSRLLDILEKRPEHMYPQFCHALDLDRQSHVTDILRTPAVMYLPAQGYPGAQIPQNQHMPQYNYQPYSNAYPPQPNYSAPSFGPDVAAAPAGPAPYRYTARDLADHNAGRMNEGVSTPANQAAQPRVPPAPAPASASRAATGASAANRQPRTATIVLDRKTFIPDDVCEIQYSKLTNLELIHEGGFGKVYEGKHAEFGDIAYKELATSVIDQKSKLSRELKKEAMAHQLRHTNIVAVLGVVFEKGHYGVVQQFVKYKGLDHLCEEYKVDFLVKMSILQGAAAGMLFLHTLPDGPLVHGELKKENVLVDEGFVPKICNFGLAKWTQFSKTKTNAQAKHAKVTLYPPEKWNNINDQRTTMYDVYGFGIMVWEAVTEKDAFGDANAEVIKSAVVKGERPDLKMLDWCASPAPADMSADVKQLTQSCWAPEPQDRPDFTAIKADLDRIMAPKQDQLKIAIDALNNEIINSNADTD